MPLSILVLKARALAVEADWSTCPDGKAVVRCATYNCPKGDTNKDGACNISDEDAKLTDLRNDALCANPPSGCGQVYYYDAEGKACASRVKDLDRCPISAGAGFTPTPASVGAACTDLKVNPTQGKAPLLVKFTTEGKDPKGAISEYEFNFGDTKSDKPQAVKQKSALASYRYEAPGTYTVSLKVKDSQGNWIGPGTACTKKITVTSSAEVLPKTGLSSTTLLCLFLLGGAGIYLFIKFKLA